jgi:hypothetical protein
VGDGSANLFLSGIEADIDHHSLLIDPVASRTCLGVGHATFH